MSDKYKVEMSDKYGVWPIEIYDGAVAAAHDHPSGCDAESVMEYLAPHIEELVTVLATARLYMSTSVQFGDLEGERVYQALNRLGRKWAQTEGVVDPVVWSVDLNQAKSSGP